MSAWRRYPFTGDFAAWKAPWDLLNRQLHRSHPLFDSRFVEPLLSHFAGDDLLVCAHHDAAAQIDGLCVLRPVRTGLWASFFPPQAPLGLFLIKEKALLGSLPAVLPGWAGAIDLLGVDPLLCDFRADDESFPWCRLEYAQTISIDLKPGFQNYWQSRSRNLAKNLRRYAHRLAHAGRSGHLVRITDPAAMAAAVARYGELETDGWKGRHGTAVSGDNIQGRFYREVMESFARTGQGTIYEYWLDDTLAASRLTISNGCMMVILKTAYRESLSAFAPGKLLLQEVIADQFARGDTEVIEFYTNANQDQLSWATDTRRISHVTVYRNEWLPHIHRFFRIVAKR